MRLELYKADSNTSLYEAYLKNKEIYVNRKKHEEEEAKKYGAVIYKSKNEVIEKTDEFDIRTSHVTRACELIDVKGGGQKADIDNLKPFHSDGWFQPMESFIDGMDGLNDEEKYCLKRSVLASMEEHGQYNYVTTTKLTSLEQHRTEMYMIGKTAVPEKYKEEFIKRTDAIIDAVITFDKKNSYQASMSYFHGKEIKYEDIDMKDVDSYFKQTGGGFYSSDIMSYTKTSYKPIQDSILNEDYKGARNKLEEFLQKYQKEGVGKLSLHPEDQWRINEQVMNMRYSWNNIIDFLSKGFNNSMNWSELLLVTSFNKAV